MLVGGAPGIGKSTLLMQVCGHFIEDKSILYVTGEESERQLKLRAERLGVDLNGMYLLAETNMDAILSDCERLEPDILVIDSIQTLYDDDMTSAPGSVLDKIALTAPKTKEVATILKNLGVNKSALLVLAGPDDTITRASANIAGLKTAYVNTINVLDILGNEKFIITEEAVKLVEEVYA